MLDQRKRFQPLGVVHVSECSDLVGHDRHHIATNPAGATSASGTIEAPPRFSSVSPVTGKSSTDRSPAATRADASAVPINPISTPIVVAATMKGSDVACST